MVLADFERNFKSIFIKQTQVSFVDSRCPDMYLFEVNTASGNSSSESHKPAGVKDEVAIPPQDLLPPKKDMEGFDRQTLPTTGFTLNIVVYYDTDFANQFQSPISRYSDF